MEDKTHLNMKPLRVVVIFDFSSWTFSHAVSLEWSDLSSHSSVYGLAWRKLLTPPIPIPENRIFSLIHFILPNFLIAF